MKIYTLEEIAELFNRLDKIARIKDVNLESDWTLVGIFFTVADFGFEMQFASYWGSSVEYKSQYVTLDELNTPLDILIEEIEKSELIRLQELEEKKRLDELVKLQKAEANKKLQGDKEYQKYLELKNKFEHGTN